ncbi:hypothetical protein PAXINDRAFT_22145 [Paxillus involutus ATCC 200175]|uniref:Unplaced genomic scaffold PAXINscaffold_2394, whole genome shotgun sequence n=1 Tax=Paxillus involutus ATCC 200175 TaxID=664439 RepID=A0A0C9TBB9_PAXIN|nr:hypothetical protein PAXINDRAFT_22145 [Paxillus involutus ATCC 200175]
MGKARSVKKVKRRSEVQAKQARTLAAARWGKENIFQTSSDPTSSPPAMRSTRSRASELRATLDTAQCRLVLNEKQLAMQAAQIRSQTAEIQQKDTELTKLGSALTAQSSELLGAAETVETLQEELEGVQGSLVDATKTSKKIYALLRNERHKSKRVHANAATSRACLDDIMSEVIPTIRRDAARKMQHQSATSGRELALLQKQATEATSKTISIAEQLTESQKKVKALQMKLLRAARSLAQAAEKGRVIANNKGPVAHLFYRKGVFTSRSRAFARTLVQAGCSQESVGTIMQKACVLLGFQEPRRMARRTVQRSVLEGGVAANIQLAHEISRSNSTLNGKKSCMTAN